MSARARKSRRRQSALRRNTLETLEKRELLAADMGVNMPPSDPANDFMPPSAAFVQSNAIDENSLTRGPSSGQRLSLEEIANHLCAVEEVLQQWLNGGNNAGNGEQQEASSQTDDNTSDDNTSDDDSQVVSTTVKKLRNGSTRTTTVAQDGSKKVVVESPNGNKREVDFNSQGEKSELRRYKMDGNGDYQLTRVIQFQEGKNHSRIKAQDKVIRAKKTTTTNYDAQGKPTQKVTEFANGTSERVVYRNGKPLVTTQYAANGNVTQRTFHNIGGRTVEQRFDADGDLTRETVTNADGSRTETDYKNSDKDNKGIKTEERKYDKNGTLRVKTEYEEKNHAAKKKKTTYYRANGTKRREDTFHDDGTKTQRHFDERGNETERYEVDKNGRGRRVK